MSLIRGSSGTGSTGLAEPVDFGRRVLEPVNFQEERLKKIENQIKMIEKGLIMPIIDSFNMFLIE